MSKPCRASYLLTLLLSCGSLLLVSIAHAQNTPVEVNDDLLAQREQLREQLTKLESSLGRHDPALIEILSSLADSSARLRLYSEASELFDRSLQIQRFNYGLFTADQIPLILAKMEIDALAGDWETLNGSIEYLRWLLLGKTVSAGESLINSLVRLSEFHLKGVIGDAADQQAHHYQQASEITYLALTISEQYWGPNDPRLVDLYYSLVKQVYLQSAAVERGDDTAYALRAVVPGSKWVRPRRIAQSRYYRAGLRLLGEMREIIALSKADSAQALAMVDLYTADWHLLFDQNRAEAAYMNAFVRLQEADIDTTELDLLFASPKILPIPAFHDSVANALASNNSVRTNQPAEQASESSTYLNFQEWLETMALISFPFNRETTRLANQEQLTEIRLRFRLDSLNDVSRWVGGRYRTNISVAESFDIFESDAGLDINMDALDQRLRLLHFRPRLENGVARPSEGTLLFIAALN